MRGPTPDSNWVIPGRLMAGAYPGNVQDEVHQTTIAALIDAGTLYRRVGHLVITQY